MCGAALEASIESCSPEGYSEASAELSARGVASAVARAFGSVLGGCDTGGKGYACVENYGWIETISIATAEAVCLLHLFFHLVFITDKDCRPLLQGP